MRRHLRWIAPLIAAPLVYLGGSLAAWASQSAATSTASPVAQLGFALLGLLLIVAGLLGSIALLIVTAVRGSRVFHEGRRARGRFTAAERARIARVESANRAWAEAGSARRRLLDREVPPTIQVWDIVARPGEVFLVDTQADYSRFYGTDASYYRTSGVYFGHPLFVVAGLAAGAIGNAGRRSAAEAAAATQWRDGRRIRLIVTNQRLICSAPEGWLSFDWGAVNAIYPDPRQWTLVLQFPSTSPLMLRGESIPLVGVFAVLSVQGLDALAGRPEMRQLGS